MISWEEERDKVNMNLFMFPFAHGVYDDAELTHDEFEVKTNDVQVSLSIILQQRILNFFSSQKSSKWEAICNA